MDEDEAFARRLQKEMDRDEEIARQPAYANNDTYGSSNNFILQSAASTPLDEDARMAQMLQDEELARRYSRRMGMQEVQQSTFLDERPDDDDGTKQARRIAQELHDAEIAQRLSLVEQESARRREVNAQPQQTQQASRNHQMFGRFVPLLCCGMILAVFLLLMFGVFNSEDTPFFVDLDPGDWIKNDPWGGLAVNNTHPDSEGTFRWQNDGNGLELEILNALDDSWQSILEKAVDNWDNGSPIDSLTLSITRVPYEINCEAETAKLKVCNGNYGKTKWRGLNEVLLNRQSNTIVSSSAKLNEYYLKYEGADQKLYTMCHEIGHGFGLPHWDEDFFNANLGNCMDYTDNPVANKQPDTSNFEFLADLYGGRNVTALAEGIPPGRRLQSKLLQEDEEEGRRILQANDHSEVHWKALDDETAILYHYLLAWEEISN
jgi:hypothetical protein